MLSAPHSAPETDLVSATRIACDGGGGALGHPRVWLSIPDERGWVDCPYCDKRYLLRGHPAAESDAAVPAPIPGEGAQAGSQPA